MTKEELDEARRHLSAELRRVADAIDGGAEIGDCETRVQNEMDRERGWGRTPKPRKLIAQHTFVRVNITERAR